MASNPLRDTVSKQYQRWVYPEPIIDIPAWLSTNWQWIDPSHSYRVFWPDQDEAPEIDMLVAGCGTNQAAVLAYTNPTARVVAVDVSEPSLDHTGYLKNRYALDNLEIHLLPLEKVASLGRDFNLIVSTGVLHHLADPLAGMQALASCLREDGVIAAMVYARYGRVGVEMMQAVFREMGLRQDDASVAVVKDTIAQLPPDHPLQSYLSMAPDLQFDAGLVDTFLHGRDRSYTVDDCRTLTTDAGLVFAGWLLGTPYAPPIGTGTAFEASLSGLPIEEQWSVMERINSRNGCHFFIACRPERPEWAYRIDFSGEGFLDYVPSLRYRCELLDAAIARPDWTIPLNESQMALLRAVDGHLSIRSLIAEAESDPELGATDPGHRRQYARDLFDSLWQRDFLAMGLTPP